MIELDSPAWKQVESACNKIGALLHDLLARKRDFRETLECIDNDLSHQLSFYTATSYALPHLAAFCKTLPLEERALLISHLGAAIAAEGAYPLPRDSEFWREFEKGLTALRPLARDLIVNHMDVLEDLPGEEGQMFVLSALAILGERRHAYYMYLYAPCEVVPVLCPRCGWDCEEVDLGPGAPLITPAEIAPWDGKSLDMEPVWLYGLLSRLDDEDFLPAVPCLYGTCKCYECDASGPLWDWMDRWNEED